MARPLVPLSVIVIAALGVTAIGLYAQTGSTEAHGRPATATPAPGSTQIPTSPARTDCAPPQKPPHDCRPTSTPTITPTPTDSATPTDTSTPTDTATNTATPTPTDTATDTATATPTDTATNTATATPTDTATSTPTPTTTETATPTPTNTPSIASPSLDVTSVNAGCVVGTGAMNLTVTLSGGSNPTGLLIITLEGPDGVDYTDVVVVAGNGTYSTATDGDAAGGFTPLVTGLYEWSALYEGDPNNSSARNTTNLLIFC